MNKERFRVKTFKILCNIPFVRFLLLTIISIGGNKGGRKWRNAIRVDAALLLRQEN